MSVNESFRDWERSHGLPKPTREAVKCSSCSCEWFEQVKAQKIDLHVISALGQQHPDDGPLSITQILLRCMACNDLQELPINLSASHQKMQDSYLDLVDQISTKKKVVKTEPDK